MKKSVLRRVASCTAAIALGLGLLVSPASLSPANAAPVAGFNAGNIIADSLFYNGQSMTAAQVQTFLNARVPRCTIGDANRAPGAIYGNNKVAASCLRNFSMTTKSKPANAYCGSYTGLAGETAATIVARVGQACGISQKVLLVMLEKEQSLVSDTWPFLRQFDVAMGYDCPDSGPNYGANCNPEQIGFFNQVYKAAWQLKVYKANPNSYNYRPYKTNTIQWHPNPSCGTSQVYLENAATAALYIYTPYRPNQAALNAGWGTGDGCSTYGNRNFYNFYTSWFGSTQGHSVGGDIGVYWRAQGAESGRWGYPVSASAFYTTKFPKGLYLQHFVGGIIVTEMDSGKTVGVPYDQVFDHYNNVTGGIYGVLGAPVSEPSAYSVNGGGTLQWFQGGLVVTASSARTTASVFYGSVYELYNSTLVGGIYGELGFPTSQFAVYKGGKLQNFQNGFIAQADGLKEPVFMGPGGFYTYYNATAGGIFGALGFPVGNLASDAVGTKRQEFERGFLMQRVGGPVIEVSGDLFEAYRLAERSDAPLGAAIGQKQAVEVNGGAELQSFDNGFIVTPQASKKTFAVSGHIYSHYNSKLGGIFGAYGYPNSVQRHYSVSGEGDLQVFQQGIIFYSKENDATAAMLENSPVYLQYNNVEGGIYGWLGFPISDEVALADGSRLQEFQNGVISVGPGDKTLSLPNETFRVYEELGNSLGGQVNVTARYSTNGGAWLSFFKNGIITQELRTGKAVTLHYSSSIYRYYNDVVGGIYGDLGYPVNELSRDASGALMQDFQKGILRESSGRGVKIFSAQTLDRYLETGAESGNLGAPTANRGVYAVSGGGVIQFLDSGLIVTAISADTTSILPHGKIYDYYNNVAGGIYGSMGFPTSDPAEVDGAVKQQFQRGTLVLKNGVVTRH